MLKIGYLADNARCGFDGSWQHDERFVGLHRSAAVAEAGDEVAFDVLEHVPEVVGERAVTTLHVVEMQGLPGRGARSELAGCVDVAGPGAVVRGAPPASAVRHN